MRKFTKKKNRIIFGSVFAGLSVALVAGLIVGDVIALGKYASVLESAFGNTGRKYTEVHYDGVDPIYYEREYSDEELLEAQQEFALNTGREGMVLLEEGNLPYAENTKISLFSKSSVDFIFGGTGSGTASSDLTLKSVMEDGGFDVNDSLWNLYEKGAGEDYHRGIGSINYGDSDDYSINEVPLSVITADSRVVSSFDQYSTAAFVLSRTGGEGNDLARGMDDYVDTEKDLNAGKHPDAEGDKKRSYLEPDSIELEIIDYLDKNFDDVILIVNCNNAMELGWIEDYPNISTVIQVPGTGAYGLQALPEILRGEVSASGRLTDTFAYSAFSSPAMMNMLDGEIIVDGKRVPNLFGQKNFDGYFYTSYSEGIYVGYRYYETRYYDAVMGQGDATSMAEQEVNASKENGKGSWDYASEVQYPFGYGASLSKFEYSDFNVTRNADDTFTATVKVTNTSDVEGREVVQLYVQAPYGDYEKENGIEKSAIELLAFGKTGDLAKNESETVTLTFSMEDLKSYDQNVNKTYVVSPGQYYFTVGKDSHAAVNNILRAKGKAASDLIASPSEEVAGEDYALVDDSLNIAEADTETYSKDTTTGTEITNQFDFASLKNIDPDYKVLSRSDWKNTYPETVGEVSSTPSKHSERVNGTDANGNPEGYMYNLSLDKNSDTYKLMTSTDSLNPNKTVPEDVKWGQEGELDLVDLRGRDKDDPLWDKLISQMSLKEARDLVENGGYSTQSVKSINKPYTADRDGPAGLNSVSGHFSLGFTYPCGLIQAQTWNVDLAEQKGDFIGEDCLKNNVTGWYGPAANIHRTPFGGRNFEYYSEDDLISSKIAGHEITGAARKGVVVYLKHFALNNQENHREKECGLLTFADEQTIRDLYLPVFERVVKEEKVEETYYEVEIDSNGKIVRDAEGNPKFTKKTAMISPVLGIMSSFNRIGPVWAGGCYPLITQVLQNEWGYDGCILTDYYHPWFMSTEQAVMAGGSFSLDPEKIKFNVGTDDKELQYYLRESVKGVLYAVANSNGVNGYIHGTEEIPYWFNYYTLLIVLNAVLVLAVGGLLTASYFRFFEKVKDPKELVTEDLDTEAKGN